MEGSQWFESQVMVLNYCTNIYQLDYIFPLASKRNPGNVKDVYYLK